MIQTPDTDEQGFLLKLDDWNQAFAIKTAESEGIQLTPEHWEIIKILRDFYEEFDLSPANRILVKQVKIKLGDNKGNSIYLMKLFPGSPAKIASKISGLPKPTNCL